MVFDKAGVHLHDPKDVDLRGAPVLNGTRDKRSRLFYFDLASDAKVNQVTTGAEDLGTL